MEPQSLKSHYETWEKFISILKTMSKYQIFLPKKYRSSKRPSELLKMILPEENNLPRVAIHNMSDTYRQLVKRTGVPFSDTFIKEVEPYKPFLTEICKTEFDMLCMELKLYETVVGTIAEVDGMEGYEFEYWCADLLRKNGFTDVEVTKGSGDQGVDVIAVKEGVRYAVQCKCYSSDLGNTPVQEVHAGKEMYHCQVGIVMTNRYFTSGAKELAKVTGTLLWDRDKLEEMLGA